MPQHASLPSLQQQQQKKHPRSSRNNPPDVERGSHNIMQLRNTTINAKHTQQLTNITEGSMAIHSWCNVAIMDEAGLLADDSAVMK